MRDVMLIVDDVEMNRVVLTQMFSNEFTVVTAKNGAEAVDYLECNNARIAMMFLDITMPVMDGFEVMEYMNDRNFVSQIPVILIIGDEENDVVERIYRLGVSDVIMKPFRVNIVRQRVHNVLEVYRHLYYLENLVLQKTKELRTQYIRIKEHPERLIEVLRDMIDCRNIETELHIGYVQGYTKILATHYAKLYPRARMTEQKIERIVKASRLHDVGKLALPDALLMRQGRLTKSELSELEAHTAKGASLMRVMTEFEDEEYSRICYNVCMYHHKKYDGTGYPEEVRRDRIPVEAQLVGLADMYDAMTHTPEQLISYTKDEIYEMLMMGECGALSPRMIECLKSARYDLEALEL